MDLEENKFKNKEIFVRKITVGFIEKLFMFLGYEIHHDRYKKVLYSEDSFKNKDEEKIKNAYDAYCYLLKNRKNALTSKILKKFFYIYFGKEVASDVALRLATKFYQYVDEPLIESAVSFHLDVYDNLDFAEKEDKLIISLMFINYVLAKNEIPTFRLLPSELNLYLIKKDEYVKGAKTDLYEFFFNFVNKEKVQDKSYYENLQPLDLKEVFEVLKEDEEFIKNCFSIKHISIFGSFAKEINRIDSDIDLLVSFSLDLTSEEKLKLIEDFKKYYFALFKRFVDISEISEYLNDDFLEKTSYVKKVF